MKQKSYIYLASPYTHTSELVRQERFNTINKVLAALVHNGYIVFGPITQSHIIAKYLDLEQTSWEYWKDNDTVFLTQAESLMICTMPGWKESVGVTAEIQIAKKLKKPISYICPKTLCITEEPTETPLNIGDTNYV